MKEEHVAYLETTYPKIFQGKYGGFAVGDGWFDLLQTTCQLIQSHCNWKQECPQVVAAQVKEKFGSLRFYYDGGDDYISGVVALAESLSGHLCEECGKPGKSGGSGWISTLCDEHRAARETSQNEN